VKTHEEYQYLDLLRKIMNEGEEHQNRTGVAAKSIFGHQMRFSLEDGVLPLLTCKKVWLKGVIHELLWLLSGNTNIKYLVDNGVHIWDEWADENLDLGAVYGQQWRRWKDHDGTEIDQIAKVINTIETNPADRGIIVSAWNVADLPKMALRPCHTMFQFNVSGDKLSCQLYQRSLDAPIGGPFNLASYSLLCIMIAQVCGLKPHEFVYTVGNAHIYSNQYEQVKEWLSREPYHFPTVKINPLVKNIDDFKYEDFELVNYKHHPALKMPIAI